MSAPAIDLTIRKTVVVECALETAFATFTAGLGRWWPVSTHSRGEGRVQTAILEERTGGRLYEVWDDGSEHQWGEVLVWEPPHRLVLSWQPNPKRPSPTEVEVRFAAEGSATRVELEHRGWDRLAAEAVDVQGSYERGWDEVLGAYRAALSI